MILKPHPSFVKQHQELRKKYGRLYKSGLDPSFMDLLRKNLLKNERGTMQLPGFSTEIGSVVKFSYTLSGALQTGSGTIPADDTIPQIGEGTQYFSLAHTAKAAANLLFFLLIVNAHEQANVGDHMTFALFQDATANALASWSGYDSLGDGGAKAGSVVMPHVQAAGDTSAHTYTVRGGFDVASTMNINGYGGVRRDGGVLFSGLVILEIKQ